MTHASSGAFSLVHFLFGGVCLLNSTTTKTGFLFLRGHWRSECRIGTANVRGADKTEVNRARGVVD